MRLRLYLTVTQLSFGSLEPMSGTLVSLSWDGFARFNVVAGINTELLTGYGIDYQLLSTNIFTSQVELPVLYLNMKLALDGIIPPAY